MSERIVLAGQQVRSRNFYVDLFGLHVAWGSDWYVSLAAPETAGAQLALVAAGHDSVPSGRQHGPGVF